MEKERTSPLDLMQWRNGLSLQQFLFHATSLNKLHHMLPAAMVRIYRAVKADIIIK